MFTRCEVLIELKELFQELRRPPMRNENAVAFLIPSLYLHFKNWSEALIEAGIPSYTEWKNKNSARSKLLLYVEKEPRTRKDIINYLSVENKYCSQKTINLYISQISLIKSIGSRNKIYYFIGDEKRAEKKHEDFLKQSKINLILSHLIYPMTKDEIDEKFNSNCYNDLKTLEKLGKIYKINFKLGGNAGSRKFKSTDLFGNLSYNTYFIKCENKMELVKFLHKNIPIPTDSNKKRSLTYYLKRKLPSEIFNLL